MFVIYFCPDCELCGTISWKNKDIQTAEMESRQAEKGHGVKTPSLNISCISRNIILYKVYQWKDILPV